MESSNFQPPVRRSLTNDELEARVNQAMTSHSGVEAVMELLVAQEALRAQEDQEEANWVASMQANGSIEALNALESFRRSNPGYVPQEVAPSQPEPIFVPEPVAPVVEEEFVPQTPVQPEIVEPVVEAEPQKLEQVFPWLNPAPPKPQVPEVEPVAVMPVIEEPVVAEPAVEEKPAQEEFSWFTQPEQTVADPVVVVEEVVESVVVELEPVGSETENEFERLLAAAAAEEELTALEELESSSSSDQIRTESNVFVPTDEHRNRGPVSQLFVWLGLSATAVPILLVWALVGFGLDEVAIALVLGAGYFASGLLIAIAAIAGKRSGLSTSVISRSVFGVWGNSIPLTVKLIARVALTAIMLAVFTFLMNGVDARMPDFSNIIASLAGINLTVGLVAQVALLFAISMLVLIRGSIARVIQVFLSLLSFGLVLESFGALAFESYSFTSAGSISFISMESLAGISLVVMANLTLWLALAPNLSKAIPMKVRGAKVFSAVLVANAVIPTLVGIAAIYWLGTLSTVSSSGDSSIQAAVLALPSWAQGSLGSGVVIAITYAAMLSLRTATLDVSALFRIKTRVPALVIAFALTVSFLVLFAQQPQSQEVEYLANVFVVIAALTAGWIGIFVADVSIRKQAYHELSLSRSYGLYKKFNILALLTWVLTLVVAVAVIPVNLFGFGFMGFALPLLGLELSLATAAIGFVATVFAGILFTVILRIPQIKKQEREVLALEARRDQLNDIFVGTE